MFDIDGVYNTQNDRVWAVDRADANKNGGIQRRPKFPQKVMIWLGTRSEGITNIGDRLDEGTVDHTFYVKKLLPVALNMGMKLLVATGSFNRMAPSHTRVI